jgi:hypothetical protein
MPQTSPAKMRFTAAIVAAAAVWQLGVAASAWAQQRGGRRGSRVGDVRSVADAPEKSLGKIFPSSCRLQPVATIRHYFLITPSKVLYADLIKSQKVDLEH